MLNAGNEYPGPRPGMVVHGIGGRHVAMQTVGAPQLWARLVALMGRPELETDPRFATPAGRREHWAELHLIICEFLDRFKTVEEAVAALTAARVPAATVLSPAEVVAHPHLAERQAFPSSTTPGRGAVRITGRTLSRRPPAGDAPRPGALPRGRAHARGPRARCSATPGSGSRSCAGSERSRSRPSPSRRRGRVPRRPRPIGRSRRSRRPDTRRPPDAGPDAPRRTARSSRRAHRGRRGTAASPWASAPRA
mgnify:CR=1 FL=1